MVLRKLILFLLVVNAHILHGQKESHAILGKIGYSSIPLCINRTDAVRWMVFPAVEVGYQMNNKLSIIGSYLHQDVRLRNYSGEKFYLYSETPELQSFDQALMFIGKKTDPSEFSNYFFTGIQRQFVKKGILEFQSAIQIGVRFGYTFIFSNVFEEPQNPNGFKAILSSQSSNSPGLKLSSGLKIKVTNFIFLEPTLGGYIFTNWPVLQYFGSLQLGISVK